MTDFRFLAQMSSDALLAVNKAGCIVYANPAAQTLLAPHAGGLEGQTTATLWQPDPFGDGEGPALSQPVRVRTLQAPAQGTALELTIDAGPDGTTYYLRVRALPRAPQGLPDRLRTAVALSTDAAMVVDARTLAFLDVNPAACALMGKDRAAVLDGGPTQLHRRDGSGVEDFHRLYAQLIDHAPQALTIEYDFAAADGRTIPIAATRQALSVDGRWLIFVTWRDISERVAAQVHVQQLKDAFDQTADAINIVDVETLTYVYVNEAFARMLALPREQVMARGPLAMPRQTVIVDDLRNYLASLVAQHPNTVVRETLTTLPDGSQQVIESHHHAFFSGGRWLARSTRADITQRKRQQRHLQRILAAFDASGDGIYIIDPRTFGYVDVNEAAARLHGVTREQLRGMGVRGAFPGRFDEAGLRARYDELIALHPRSLTEDRQIPRADGVVVWAESIRRAIQVDGEWLVISVMRDVTERRAAQARLAQFKAAFDQTSDAVAIVDVGAMAYVYNNDANLRLLGISREEMDTLSPVQVAARLGDTADQSAHFARLIAQYPEPITREISYVHRDGRTLHYSIRHQAMKSDSGWLAISTKTDITERREAQLSLELLKAAIEAAPDAIAVIDPHTLQYVHVNAAVGRALGVSREELMARGVDGMFGQERAAASRERYADLIRCFPEAKAEERLVQMGGKAVPYEAVRRAVRVGDRWLIIAVNRDVSERKAQQAKLQLLHQAIDAAPDAIVVIDPATLEYIDVNEATVQMYGLTREELLARGVRGNLHGKSSDEETRQFHATIVQQAPRACVEERSAHLLGRNVTLEFTHRAVNVDGRWLIVSVTRDITERRAAQARAQRFAAIVNLSADAVFVVNRQTMTVLDINEATVRMYGQPREAIVGHPIHVITRGQKDSPGLLEAEYDQVIAAAPAISSGELTVLRADGATFQAEIHRMAIQSEGQWLVVITVRDISERKAAQARQMLLTAAIEAAPDGIAVVDPDTLQYIHANEAACRTHGVSREELMARGVDGIFSGQMSAQAIRALYASVIRHHPEATTEERAIVADDGSTTVYEAVRRAVRVDNRWLIISMNRDVSERKQAENEIRRRVAELELLREAYDAASDAIMIADPDTLGYYDVNNAAVKLLGVSREELLRRGVEASYYSTAGEPFEPERFRKGSRYVISRAPQAVLDVRTVKPLGLGGRDTVIEFSRRGVNINGRWVIVTIMRDITAARQAEEEIRQRVAELTRSNQELEQFAYVTSHDLSEPLRMVASYTQLLARRYADKFDDDGREFIKYAVDGAQRMKQLIDDLLMYSRAGRHNVQMRHMRMDRALDDALANLANAIERTGATIERDPLPELVCEKAGLTQVFQNLIGNALKFRGDAAPVVRISAAEDEHFWTISVKDNGIGIAPEYFQRIFIIFQRLHSRTKYEGTGIGLSICKKIVERHGGQISVTSEHGQGTTFSFTLSKSLTESEPS